MSEYQPFDPKDKFDMPYAMEPPQRRGSGCLKVFVITAVLGVIGSVACCAGMTLYVMNNFTRSPEEGRELANRLVSWEFNDEFTAVFSVDLFLFRMVTLSKGDRSAIVLIQIPFMPKSEVGEPLDDSGEFNFPTGDDEEDTEVLEEHVRTIPVRGKDIQFVFRQTRGRESGMTWWEVGGIIPGERGPIIVALKLDAGEYDADTIARRLESIR
jgi:hypothetical protein